MRPCWLLHEPGLDIYVTWVSIYSCMTLKPLVQTTEDRCSVGKKLRRITTSGASPGLVPVPQFQFTGCYT